jgi:predicted lipoprotein with Yx(FWY)xxD motif
MHLLRIVGLITATAAVAVTVAVGTASAGASGTTRVQVRHGSLGRYLVDGRGRSLYLFERDRGGRSACFGACAYAWPPLLAKGRVARGAGVSSSKLGTIARRGGTRQVTYAGHPLYLYGGDSRPGQIRGEGLNQFGAPWDIVSPSGKGIDR